MTAKFENFWKKIRKIFFFFKKNFFRYFLINFISNNLKHSFDSWKTSGNISFTQHQHRSLIPSARLKEVLEIAQEVSKKKIFFQNFASEAIFRNISQFSLFRNFSWKFMKCEGTTAIFMVAPEVRNWANFV